MTPAPPAEARVLELGCGTGANLLPLAIEFPGARIVGCDLAELSIAFARDLADALGIGPTPSIVPARAEGAAEAPERVGGLELRSADILTVDDSWGTFDYIVCHDVFSWVAPNVRRKILEIYARNLAPQGVGYLSHDTYPGWHLHEVALDMMRYRTRHIEDPKHVIEESRSILAMAACVQDQNPDAYAALIRDEYCVLSAVPDEQLYHLVSSKHHRPFYFHEFFAEVEEAGLQWLADATGRAFIPRMDASRSPWMAETPQSFLEQSTAVEQEQHCDFLNNRTSRRAVLCHRNVSVRSGTDAEVFRKCWVSLAGVAQVGTKDPTGGSVLFKDRIELRSTDPSIRTALLRLDEVRPAAVLFSHLFEQATEDALGFMMDAFEAGAIEAVLTPHSLTNQIHEFPRVNRLVRLQARDGEWVTNQKSEPLQLTALVRFVVQRLDGSYNRASLTDALGRELASSERKADLLIYAPDPSAQPSALVDECLRYAREHALLI